MKRGARSEKRGGALGNVLWAALLVVGGPLPAQQPAARDTTRIATKPLIHYGKWITAAGAAGAATVGILANRSADRRYDDLERICETSPARCEPRTPSGAYADASLEREYQSIKRLDDRAKLSLLATEIGVVTSVVLFILDLRPGSGGQDIPYKPPRLQVGMDGQARMQLLLRVR